jgi:hypothetical protein
VAAVIKSNRFHKIGIKAVTAAVMHRQDTQVHRFRVIMYSAYVACRLQDTVILSKLECHVQCVCHMQVARDSDAVTDGAQSPTLLQGGAAQTSMTTARVIKGPHAPCVVQATNLLNVPSTQRDRQTGTRTIDGRQLSSNGAVESDSIGRSASGASGANATALPNGNGRTMPPVKNADVLQHEASAQRLMIANERLAAMPEQARWRLVANGVANVISQACYSGKLGLRVLATSFCM